MSHPELSRDLLLAAGGHVEFKMARGIHKSGNVQSARYENGVLSGELRMGGKLKKVSMEIISPTHMENKCTCPMVRRDGRVCSHIIAVGLEVVEPLNPPEEKTPEVVVEDRWPKISEAGKALSLQVMLMRLIALALLPIAIKLRSRLPRRLNLPSRVARQASTLHHLPVSHTYTRDRNI